jgi:hypothetical protein
MKLPVDFEQKVKLPPTINGRSYPYQISARDLMQDFRYSALQVDGAEVNGLKLTETSAIDGTRTVKLDGSLTTIHPWAVTDLGDGTVSIGAGYVNAYFMTYVDAGVPIGPDASGGPTTIVAGPLASYSGGVETISGTQYIYAEFSRNQAFDEYCQSEGSGNDIVLASVYNEFDPLPFVDGDQADTATIVVSSSTPDTYVPPDGAAARCIAKVTESGSDLVINQYITHNFDMFLPIVKLTVVTNTLPP